MKIKPYHCNFSNIYHYTKIGLEKQQNRVYVWYTHSTLKELMSLLRSFVEDMFELQKSVAEKARFETASSKDHAGQHQNRIKKIYTIDYDNTSYEIKLTKRDAGYIVTAHSTKNTKIPYENARNLLKLILSAYTTTVAAK